MLGNMVNRSRNFLWNMMNTPGISYRPSIYCLDCQVLISQSPTWLYNSPTVIKNCKIFRSKNLKLDASEGREAKGIKLEPMNLNRSALKRV